jgi:hypothetical protein
MDGKETRISSSATADENLSGNNRSGYLTGIGVSPAQSALELANLGTRQMTNRIRPFEDGQAE